MQNDDVTLYNSVADVNKNNGVAETDPQGLIVGLVFNLTPTLASPPYATEPLESTCSMDRSSRCCSSVGSKPRYRRAYDNKEQSAEEQTTKNRVLKNKEC